MPAVCHQYVCSCRHVGTSTDLLPLLQLPADDPRDTTPAAAAAGTAAGTSSTGSTTVLSALRRLEQQAKLYRCVVAWGLGVCVQVDCISGEGMSSCAALGVTLPWLLCMLPGQTAAHVNNCCPLLSVQGLWVQQALLSSRPWGSAHISTHKIMFVHSVCASRSVVPPSLLRLQAQC
jgi:hypothetical protein